MRNTLGEVKYKVFYAQAVYGDEEKKAVMDSLDNPWLAHGPKVAEFEEKIAKLFDKRGGLATNSGSSANLLAMSSLDLPPGSEVITPACTFATTVSEIFQNNLIPVFVDAVVGRYTIDEDLVESAISPKTKALMVPHLIGGVVDLVKMRKIADRYGLYLIDDSCFVSGTRILTKSGEKNIESIRKGDYVLTRNGYSRVLEAEKTGKKRVITRFGITGTPNHPFITKGGIKRFDNLNVSDIIYIWNQEKLCMEEGTIIDILDQNYVSGESTTGEAMASINQKLHSIGKLGLINLEKFLKGITFTIKTTIHLITPQVIWNYSLTPSTQASTLANQSILQKLEKTFLSLNRKQRNGIEAKKVEDGTVRMVKNHGKIEKHLGRGARFVRKIINLIFLIGQDIVLGYANREAEVYNLKVEGNSEYFANGVLVHNCDTLGATLHGKSVGHYSDISTTSFYGSHIITASGLGGMVCFNDDKLMARAKIMRDWGRAGGDQEDFDERFNFKIDKIPYDSKFLYKECGYNLKINEVSAAFGLVQLSRLEEFAKKRSEAFRRLLRFFGNYKKYFHLPKLIKGAETSWLAFPLTIKKDAPFNRYNFLRHMEEQKIQTRVLFSGNITRHPLYKRVESKYRIASHLGDSDLIMANGLLLGCHQGMTNENINYLISSADEFLRNV